MAMVWPANEHGLLFPTKLSRVRNPSNANRDLRAAAQRVDPELEWVTSRTFRKTIATRLDEVGLSARTIWSQTTKRAGQRWL
jgi:integrase